MSVLFRSALTSLALFLLPIAALTSHASAQTTVPKEVQDILDRLQKAEQPSEIDEAQAELDKALTNMTVPKEVQDILDEMKKEDEQSTEVSEAPTEANKPLTNEDIQMYLRVMQAAVERVRSLPAQDRRLLEKAAAVQAGKKEMSSMTPEEINRVSDLSAIDMDVAREMGVFDRYQWLPNLVASRAFDCDSCGDPDSNRGKNQPPTAAETAAGAQWKAEVALVLANRKKIVALERQLRPFSPLGKHF